MKIPNLNFDFMEGLPVYDENKDKLGYIDDLFIRLSNEIELSKIVIRNVEITGILKKLNLQSQDLLHIPLRYIETFDPDKVITSLRAEVIEQLEEDTDLVLENEYSFKKMKSNEVHDTNGVYMGRIKNLLLREDLQIILGDGFFEELLEDLGAIEDTDLLLEISEIDMIDETVIRLKKSVDQYQKVIRKTNTDDFRPFPTTLRFPLMFHHPA